MLNRVIISAEELKNAALSIMLQKPAFYGKYVATVEFCFDPSDPEPMRQIRIEVVLTDTEGGAARYLKSGEVREDEPPADAPAAASVESPAAENLEGTKRVNK